MGILTRFGIPILLLIGLGAFVHACTQASSTQLPAEGVQEFAQGNMRRLQFDRAGTPVSTAEFIGPQEESLTLADFQGRVVVLNFWGTTCAPCVIEMPTLANLQAAFDPSKLYVLALSFDRVGDYPVARQELTDLTDDRLSFYGDPARGVMFDSYVAGFPTTIIYDTQGREVARFEGDTDWATEESLTFFQALLDTQEFASDLL